MTENMHVLIIGGGIAGLSLAQALRLYSIPYTLFERDPSANCRPQGWGITLHSTLTNLESHVSADVYDAIVAAQVNPEAGRDEVRDIPYVNCDTGEVVRRVPKGKRLRMRRDGVRAGLMKDLDIQWGKKLTTVERTESGVRAFFDDGTHADGSVLVGADGAWSAVRRIVAPDNHAVRRLPCNAVGTSFYISAANIAKLREQVDTLYFFGTDPKTNTYTFWSMLEQPQDPAGMFKMQLYFSWIPKAGDDSLEGLSAREVLLKKGSTMFKTLRDVMACIPDDEVVSFVNLVETPVVGWDNWGGKVTLAGDSAHCMSIYRGEGVNHGVIDACVLADALKRVKDGECGMEKAVEDYEIEMKVRGQEAVDISRQACIDAHDYKFVTEVGSFALLGKKKV